MLLAACVIDTVAVALPYDAVPLNERASPTVLPRFADVTEFADIVNPVAVPVIVGLTFVSVDVTTPFHVTV